MRIVGRRRRRRRRWLGVPNRLAALQRVHRVGRAVTAAVTVAVGRSGLLRHGRVVGRAGHGALMLLLLLLKVVIVAAMLRLGAAGSWLLRLERGGGGPLNGAAAVVVHRLRPLRRRRRARLAALQLLRLRLLLARSARGGVAEFGRWRNQSTAAARRTAERKCAGHGGAGRSLGRRSRRLEDGGVQGAVQGALRVLGGICGRTNKVGQD